MSHLSAHMDQYMGSEEAVASLMDLRSGLEGGSFLKSPNAQLLLTRRIGDIALTHDRVEELFQQYVTVQSEGAPCLTILPASSPSTILSCPSSILQEVQTSSTNHRLCYFGP